MVDASRRAARKPVRGGLPNALFVISAAEALPFELEGAFDEVTVHFPWGSLLCGLATADPTILAGLTRALKPGGSLRILLSITERESTIGLQRLTSEAVAQLGQDYARRGLQLVQAGIATDDVVAASHSTWAKRLGAGREAWLLVFRKCKGVIETGDGRAACA